MPTDKTGYDPEQFFDEVTRDINIKVPEPAPFPPSPSGETIILNTNSLPVKADFNEDKTRIEISPRKTVAAAMTEDTPIPEHIVNKKATGEFKLPPPVPKHGTRTPITSITNLASGQAPTLPSVPAEGVASGGTNSKIRAIPLEVKADPLEDIDEPAAATTDPTFVTQVMALLAVKPVQLALATVVVVGAITLVANLLGQKSDPASKSQSSGIALDLERPWLEYKPKYQHVESLESDFSAQ